MIESLENTNESSQFDVTNVQTIIEALASGQGESLLNNLTSSDSAGLVSSLLTMSDSGSNAQIFIDMLKNLDDVDSADDAIIDVDTELAVEESPLLLTADKEQKIKYLLEELQELRIVNDTLASALGACPYCWGDDNQCPECGGQGCTGSMPVTLKLFDELVAPAVLRVQKLNRSVTNVPDLKRR